MGSSEAVQATVSIGTLSVVGLALLGAVLVVIGAVGVGLKRKWGLVLSALGLLGPTLVGALFSVVAIGIGAGAAGSSQDLTYAMGPTHVGCVSMCVGLALFVIAGWVTFYHWGDFGKTQPSKWR